METPSFCIKEICIKGPWFFFKLFAFALIRQLVYFECLQKMVLNEFVFHCTCVDTADSKFCIFA